MDITSVVFGIVFIIFGFLTALGLVHVHVSLWKQTPEEEKEKIRIKTLCLNIGEMIMLCGIIFLINGLWVEGKGHFFIIAIIAWLIICVLDLLFIIKSNHYKKHSKKDKLFKQKRVKEEEINDIQKEK